MNTKYALMVYNSRHNIFNVGDFVQSLAAKQFLPSVDFYIDRERMDEYKGDEVKLILNGWFMHDCTHWPPSENILPLFVAFHLNSSIYHILEESSVVDYFKRYEPIGCRDIRTKEKLESKGIKAYFSACMTLTLGHKYKALKRREDNIYFTDPYCPTEKNIIKLLPIVFHGLFSLSIVLHIREGMYGDKTLSNFVRACNFYSRYKQFFTDDVLKSAIFIHQEIPDIIGDYNAKFDLAESLLDKYANARFVVTSRIHCALPCLALETPVLYVENGNDKEISRCRLDGLLDLFHRIIWRDKKGMCTISNKQMDVNTHFENKSDYKVYRDQLIKSCQEFVAK